MAVMERVKAAKTIVLVALIGLVFGSNLLIPTAHATTLQDLLNQQAALQQQQSSIKQKIGQSQQKASDLQGAITDLSDSISTAEQQIVNTEAQIAVTSQIINQLNNQIAEQQANLTQVQDQLRSAYDSLYEMSQGSTFEILAQGGSLNDAVTQAQYIQSLQTRLQAKVVALNSMLKEFNNSKQQNEKQKDGLVALNNSLTGQKNSLNSQKNQKNYLLNATNDQITSYLSDYSTIQKKLADLQKQINTLVSTSAWGGDIISSNDSNWYYSQLDYPNTYLGNSPYTVHDYGCLVTSFAMVATFYGHRVTPATIAGIASNFDRGGNLLVQPPASSGLSSSTTQAINWGVVNSELAAGHPVIVSIYLPSVGAINADGSSHFIVLKGVASGKYLMHDPIGAGRSYGIGQVRSMKVVR